MVWGVILFILAVGFVAMCVEKFRTVSRKDGERRIMTDEKEFSELIENYKDFDDFD